MVRRTFAALAWLLAAWAGAGTVAYLAMAPAIVGPLAGLAVGLLVWWDPSGRLWDRGLDRAVMRRRLADLERVSPSAEARSAAWQPEVGSTGD